MPVNRYTALFNGQRSRGGASRQGPAAAPHGLAALPDRPGLPGGAVAEPERFAAAAAGAAAPAGSGVGASAAAAAASSGAPSRRSADVRDSKVQEWLQVANRNRIGPKLHALREEHQRAGLPLERYSMAHVHQLGTARQGWVQQPRVYCKNIHRKRDRDGRSVRCAQCTTCHWCRQKTTCMKTQCSACHGNRDNIYGGPYAGVICGNCLWTRFGENLNEVVRDPSWTCPACRQICNCSANNCVRTKNGWICTDQINTEATSLGYESVAHYLVLAQLDESLWADITDNVNSLQPMVDRAILDRAAAVKHQRSAKNTASRLQEDAAPLVERQLAAVHAAVGFSAQRALEIANSNRRLLAQLGFGHSTLAADLREDEEEEEEEDMASPGSEVAPAGTRLQAEAQGQQPDLASMSLASLCTALGGSTVAGSAWAARRFPPRPPGQLPLQPVQSRAPVAAAAAPADGLLDLSAASFSAAARGSRGELIGATRQSACTDAADDLNAGRGSGLASESGTAECSGTKARQQQVQGLLHEDHHAAFPAVLLEGNGMLPSTDATAGCRPACDVAASRVPQPLLAGAAVLAASLPQHQGLRQRQQQQARLTPTAAGGNKQQQWQAVEAGAALPLPAIRSLPALETEPATEGAPPPGAASNCSRQQEGHVSGGTVPSPSEAAESSQQLGLSPHATFHAAASGRSVDCEPSKQVATEVPSPQADAGKAAGATTRAPVSFPAAAVDPGKVRQHSGVALEWGHLLRTAELLVTEMEASDPSHPSYRPDASLATVDAAETRYRDVYNVNMAALQGILTDANKCLAEPFLADIQQELGVAGSVVSVDVLYPLIGLYNFLAGVLPDDAVRWQIVPRLLRQDCFVDFANSGHAARLLLVEGMMSLLQTLRGRQLCIKDTCQSIASAVATMATELQATSELLSEVLDAEDSPIQQHPTQDWRIGPYVYDAEERRKDVGRVFSQLEANYSVLEDVLRTCLAQCMSAARLVEHDAGHLLDPLLMSSLLKLECSMPRDVKRAGLALFFTVLSLSSQAHQKESIVLSVAETNRRRELRMQLCQVVLELLPTLEALVAAEYPLWRPAASAAAAAGSGAAATSAGSGAENLGQEAVTALGRAYGFLMECQQMTWRQLEEAVCRPYSSPATFWQFSNRMYRCFGMALMADTLRHAPSIQVNDQHAHVWMLKHWLLCLLDRGKRFTTGESLTMALAKQTHLAVLFSGLHPDELAIGDDRSSKRAANLLGSVIRRMCGLSWQPLLGELLHGLDELLERREKETAGGQVHTKLDRLRYGARLYRLLAAILSATASARSTQKAAGVPGSRGAWTGGAPLLDTGSLRQLAQRMAMLATGSCLVVHRDCRMMRTWASTGNHDGVHGMLQSKADVRQRLQRLPFGEVGSLWRVLLCWDAPQSFASDLALLKPMWTVIGCVLELCSGGTHKDAALFDDVVLARLADSLLTDTGNQGNGNGMAQLRDYVLATFVRRYLGRSHLRHVRNERNAVNAVRFLQALLEAAHSTGGADVEAILLPMLPPLLCTLLPLERGAEPSLAVREAVHRMLACLLEWYPRLLPPLAPAPVHGAQGALHAFWTAAAADAVLCCQQPVLGCVDNATRCKLLATLSNRKVSPKLLPLSSEVAVDASNKLLHRLLDRQQYSVQPLEQLVQRQGQQLELMLKEEVAASDGERGSTQFRPADFNWTAAGTAMQLIRAFLKAGKAEVAAQAVLSPVQPGAAADVAQAASGSWEQLPAGYQWALACIPALDALVPLGESKLGPLKEQYKELQKAASIAMPDRFRRRSKQSGRQLQQPAAPTPAVSTIGEQTRSDVLRLHGQQRELQAAAPTGSSVMPSAGMPQPCIKQEPVSQAARPHGHQAQLQQPDVAGQQQHVSDASQQPQRHRMHVTHNVQFDRLGFLEPRSKVAAVGVLAKCPELKVFDKGPMLRLELWNHRRAKLMLLVPEQHALFQELQAEAYRRFNSHSSDLRILRVADALYLGLTGAAVEGAAEGPATKSPTCILRDWSRLEWEPSGDLADKIRRAVAAGRLQLPPGQPMQQQGAQESRVCMTATPQGALTQLTPVMRWDKRQTQQASMRDAALQHAPRNTQLEDVGIDQTQLRKAPKPRAMQAQLSQAAPAAACQQLQQDTARGATAVGDQWRRMALDVVFLLKDKGLPRNEVIHTLKGLAHSSSIGRQQLLVAGAEQVAAHVQILLT